jgi:MoaA/NifB/PqqE/SkfB family radical SAM enzyme
VRGEELEVIAFAEVVLGSGGVVRCTRCTPAEPPREFLPAERILAQVREAARGWESGPGPNVAFVGVEPFAHPELPAIVAGARSSGVQRIRLRTDGGALSVAENASGALHAGVRHIEVVLLGAGPEHDALAGRAGLFADARDGMFRLREAAVALNARVAVTGVVPVCRHNLEHAAAAVAALAEAGAVAVELDVSPSAATAVGARDWLSAAIDTGTTAGVWVSVTGLAEPPGSKLHLIAPAVVVGR